MFVGFLMCVCVCLRVCEVGDVFVYVCQDECVCFIVRLFVGVCLFDWLIEWLVVNVFVG